MINVNDAPEGMYAVEIPYGYCGGCYYEDIECPLNADGKNLCATSSRKDRTDVTFVKKQTCEPMNNVYTFKIEEAVVLQKLLKEYPDQANVDPTKLDKLYRFLLEMT